MLAYTHSVDSIEIHADLAAGAARTLAGLGDARVSGETGDALAREYDAAYAVGVWEGARRARTVAPLTPDLTSWPRPSRYERRRGDGSDRSTPGTPTPG